VIDLYLRCTPPSTTAQKKGMRFVNGKPQFFHNARMQREEVTWTSLLAPHRPQAPLTGPLELSLCFIYPHLKSTPKKRLGDLVPKTTKPDCGNVAKHLEDHLTKLRFIEDDARIARLIVEKFHGPESHVGIRVIVRPFPGVTP